MRSPAAAAVDVGAPAQQVDADGRGEQRQEQPREHRARRPRGHGQQQQGRRDFRDRQRQRERADQPARQQPIALHGRLEQDGDAQLVPRTGEKDDGQRRGTRMREHGVHGGQCGGEGVHGVVR